MKYLKFTYVDALTGISIASQPAANGPVFPPVVGLQYEWARESQYPTDVPEFFGTCPDSSDTQIDGVLGVFSQTDWEQMREDEIGARAALVRARRNGKLTASDWTQVADAPVDKAAWATYRQALRDITAQAGFPWAVKWPEQP